MWPYDQRLRTRPFRLPPYHDDVYGMDVSGDLYPLLFAVFGGPSIRRGYVRYPLGSFSGMPLAKPSTLQYCS